MPTTADLGRAVKQRYPGKYDSLSDSEVGRRVKEKFPGKYDEYIDLPSDEQRTEKQVKQLMEHYEPSKGRLGAWWARGKAKSRVKLLEVLNQEQALVIEQGAMLERAVLEGRQRRVDFEMYVRKNAYILHELRAKEVLIDQALESGFTVESDQAVRLSKAMIDIEVEKHQRLKEIDLDIRYREILQDSNAADLAQIGDHLVIKKLRQELIEARKERHVLRTGSDPEELKQELLADYDKFISRLEAKIDERETGHLLSENRPKARELTEGSANSRPDYPPETDEDSE